MGRIKNTKRAITETASITEISLTQKINNRTQPTSSTTEVASAQKVRNRIKNAEIQRRKRYVGSFLKKKYTDIYFGMVNKNGDLYKVENLHVIRASKAKTVDQLKTEIANNPYIHACGITDFKIYKKMGVDKNIFVTINSAELNNMIYINRNGFFNNNHYTLLTDMNFIQTHNEPLIIIYTKDP